MAGTKIRWLVIVILVLTGFYFLLKVKNVILPFTLGFALAYLLNPAVSWLEKKGLNRQGSVAVITIWIVFFLVAVLFFLLPRLYLELGKLAAVLPDKIEIIQSYAENAKNNYFRAGLTGEISKLIEEQLKEGQEYLIKWLDEFIDTLPGIITSLGLLVLSPVLAVYFLLDWSRMCTAVLKLVPQRVSGRWNKFLQEVDLIVHRYIQGNVLDSLIVGLLIGLGVKLVGMDYAFIIGIICGITNLIPYFGPFIGGVPSALLGLSISPFMSLKVILVIFVVQQLDSNIIHPRLMSRRIGLHPIWVIFALLAGGQIMGFVGMLLAIPAAAVLRIIIRDIYYYLVSPRVINEK